MIFSFFSDVLLVESVEGKGIKHSKRDDVGRGSTVLEYDFDYY